MGVTRLLALLFFLPAICRGQAVDHFEVGAPGFQNGNHPRTLYAGDCFTITVEAKDAAGQVVTAYNGSAVVTQWAINDQTGVLLQARPGISKASDIAFGGHLGKSSVTVTMTNGVYTFGAGGDLSTRLCFYAASRAPQDYKQTDQLGDFVLTAALPGGGSPGISPSYVAWHNTPQKIILLLPNEVLAPATPTGSSGTLIAEQLGVPFASSVRIVDQFWNQIVKDNSTQDTIQLTASHPTSISFNPVQASMTEGILSSVVTVTSSAVCATTVTLTATDLNAHGPNFVASDSQEVYISSCTGGGGGGNPGQNPGFYQLSVPGVVTAGSNFSMDVIAKNVDITSLGSLQYTGSFSALIAVSQTQFAPASGSLGVPVFDFSIPSGFSGDYTNTIANQTFTTAQTIWIQLVGGASPPELEGASVIAGPIQVLPSTPAAIEASASPSILGARATSRLSLALNDAFGNGIAGKTLIVQMTQGSQGSLNAGGVSGTFIQVVTDPLGRATLDFTAGTISESVVLQVSAPAYPSIPAKSLSILVTLIGDKRVAAYPSPVKITERPLVIEYRLDDDSDVTLTIFDLFGQEVWRTSRGAGSSGGRRGFNKITWDGANGIGRTVAVGVYSLRLEMNANGQVTESTTRFGVRK